MNTKTYNYEIEGAGADGESSALAFVESTIAALDSGESIAA